MLRLTFPRVLLIIAALGTAIVLQSSIFARLGLPGSTPDLLLVAVLVIALVAGPLVGAVTGFAGGLLADIAPPAAGSLGQTAAIYALAGFVIGHAQFEPGRVELQSVLSVSGVAAAVVLLQAILGTLLGQPEVVWSIVPLLIVTQFVYSAVLSLIMIPSVGLLYRGAGDEGRFA
jgi:rod shape-determining protein MreD